MKVVFMLEEPSMRTFLKILLPRLFPGVDLDEQVNYSVFQGKQDLDRKLGQRIAAWKTPGTTFLIVRDQDWDDCRVIKRRLAQHSSAIRHDEHMVVRIACRCLEAFYLGSAALVCEEYKDSALEKRILSLGDPDQMDRPAQWLEQSIRGFSKTDAARRMAGRLPLTLDPGASRSRSYCSLLKTLAALKLQ
jgi:hypothetical protein